LLDEKNLRVTRHGKRP